jgi:predicted transcriptional regulator
MKNCHSLPLPFLAFFMLLRVLTHRDMRRPAQVYKRIPNQVSSPESNVEVCTYQGIRHIHAWRRDNTMPQSLVEIVKDLTMALVETGNILPEDMQDTLQKTYATLSALKAQEESGVVTVVPAARTPPGNWRKSITRHAVTCLECGESFKQLSIRHLRQHGLDARSYRTKYGIPQSQPLAARDTTARRRQVVQETRPWEKAPTFRKGQTQEGSEAPESEVEAVSEETEAPSAQAPAQPKRQRKTTPKKQTGRKKQAAG